MATQPTTPEVQISAHSLGRARKILGHAAALSPEGFSRGVIGAASAVRTDFDQGFRGFIDATIDPRDLEGETPMGRRQKIALGMYPYAAAFASTVFLDDPTVGERFRELPYGRVRDFSRFYYRRLQATPEYRGVAQMRYSNNLAMASTVPVLHFTNLLFVDRNQRRPESANTLAAEDLQIIAGGAVRSMVDSGELPAAS